MALVVGTPTSSFGTGVTLTFSVTVDAGNPGLIVIVSREANLTGVTFNGDAMTQVRTQGGLGNIYVFKLVNPDVGTHDVVVTGSGGNNTTAAAIPFTGADQSTLTGADNGQISGSAGTTASTNITTTADGSVVVDIAQITFGTLTANGAQTQVVNQNLNDWVTAGSYKSVPTATATSMSWTIDTARDWTQIVVEVLAAAATSDIFSVSSVAQANIKAINAITNANIKSVSGVNNT